MELSLSNVINVTIQGTPSGIDETNVNSLGLFTNETPGFLDAYRLYLNSREVGVDFGTSSVTYLMAENIFSQSPNILAGNGRLVIVPLQASVAATIGDWVSADLTANLAALIVVTDGDIRVTIDGDNIDLTGVDFTNATTIAGVGEILQASLTNVIVTESSNLLTFTSKKSGLDSDVIVATLPGGAGTDLAAAGLLNTAAGTPTSGANSSGETISAAITRTEGTVDYVGIMTNMNLEDTAVSAIAATVQSKDMMFLHHFASTEDIAGIATTVQAATQTKTRCLGYFNTLASANLMKAAYAGRAYSVNFSGSNTSQTLWLKTLASVTPDPNVNQTLYTAALTAGMDLYVSYSVSAVYSTGGNLYFDQVYSRLALKFALETSGFNYLRQTNTKVPQTESGMNGLKGAYNKVMDRFVANGYIAPGTWTSSETFGNQESFLRTITEKGYYTYSQPVALQSSVEREAREAPLVQIAAKEAGAFHTSDVTVVVNP